MSAAAVYVVRQLFCDEGLTDFGYFCLCLFHAATAVVVVVVGGGKCSW